ncbi:FHA domain-containing protein [Microbacterium enclense]|uniref:FHA domain-containing protein n=1 Tax=Microbacterium enclense TaxID=993073 RepID=A0A3S3P475_9MICO|nr:DUF5684 domain-containing protein [Microbacterium enclense]RWR19166.1 FHA domain-containing protein [Microbacterium enclense]
MNDSTGVILGALTLLLFVIVYVWYALALAAVFAKAGEATWKAWVPVVNVATILALGGFSPWLVLLNLIPLFGTVAFAVVLIVAIHRVNLGFGRGAGMTVLGAFLGVVWASVLGFGSARWRNGTPGARRSGGMDENSAPVRRGQDFAGPYVPLVGGWTPEPASRADAGEDAPVPGPASEAIVLPYAAVSPSLADAPPPPTDWAPRGPADAPDFAPPAGDARAPLPFSERPVVADDARASVSEALAALRAPTDGDVARDERARTAEHDEQGEGEPDVWSAGPLTPAVPSRSRTSAETPAVTGAPEEAPADDAAPRPEPWRAPSPAEGDDAGPTTDESLTRPAPVAGQVWPAPARTDEGPGEEFPELSEAVSAVSDAPQAGAPRSARTSVSALYTQPEFPAEPDDAEFDALDRTVVTRRRRIPWALVPPSGAPVDLTSDVVILGRRPAPDAAHPDAQLVAISDETRTVSKTHARLQLRGDVWFVTDLDSTNGVLFATLMGTEVEAPPGEEIEAGERFFLGDAEVRLTRREP